MTDISLGKRNELYVKIKDKHWKEYLKDKSQASVNHIKGRCKVDDIYDSDMDAAMLKLKTNIKEEYETLVSAR